MFWALLLAMMGAQAGRTVECTDGLSWERITWISPKQLAKEGGLPGTNVAGLALAGSVPELGLLRIETSRQTEGLNLGEGFFVVFGGLVGEIERVEFSDQPSIPTESEGLFTNVFYAIVPELPTLVHFADPRINRQCSAELLEKGKLVRLPDPLKAW